MEEAKQKKQEYKIPEIILSMTKGTIEYPSIIETDFYVKEALDLIVEKNTIVQSIKYFDGKSISLREGLVKFKKSNSYLYFTKRVDENTYKFFAIMGEESTDSMIFFLNSLKKFKTI